MGAVSQYLKVHNGFVTKQFWIISINAGIQTVFSLLPYSKIKVTSIAN